MRKRRPPFHSPRRVVSPPCFYPAPEATGCGKKRDNQHSGKHPDGLTGDGIVLQVHNNDLNLDEEEEEEEDAEGNEVRRKRRRRALRSHRCSVLPGADGSLDVEAGGGNERHRRMRDSCGYWDSDSSSSTDFCYYHRPYCDSCLQRGSLMSSESSSDSDSEYEGYASLYRSPHPVVFKEDLKPTFV